MLPRSTLLMLWALVVFESQTAQAFNLVMMGVRRGKGSLKRILDPSSVGDKKSGKKGGSVNSLNGGLGQEITGVSLPAEGTIKGWEFGGGAQVACANVNGQFYALQGDCPRCAFDLFRGDLLTDSDVWEDTPRVACPTCCTTFSFRNGKRGPPLKRTGLSGFVGNLAKTATQTDSEKDAKAFKITRVEDGRVYCRDV